MRFSIALPQGICAIALAAGLACDGPNETTLVSLRLKDAPGDLQQAVVTIREIDLVGSGGVQVLTTTPSTTDLLTLTGTAATLVQDAEVPSGTYGQLRFKITGACIVVDNGDATSSIYTTEGYDPAPCGGPPAGVLQAPSFDESGLKVTMGAGALEITGPAKVLLVDFDVSQSFGHATGGSDGWVMHPVITGTTLETGPTS
jgi:hypothetical protein